MRFLVVVLQLLLLLLLLPTVIVKADVVISEILASNEQNLADEDGDFSDWVELHNTDAAARVNVAGFALTDDPQDLQQWTFPAKTWIPPNGYLVVFCSGKDRRSSNGNDSPLHTNFKLSSDDGSFLALSHGNGTLLDAFDPYPAQTPDRSYGRSNNNKKGQQLQYFSTPTPGARNNGDYPPAVSASVASGLHFTSPFTVTLSLSQGSDIDGVTIRYTRDGSEPTAGDDDDDDDDSTSFVYSTEEPIAIETTTILRASAFINDNNEQGGEIATYSYIFIPDVIQQPRKIPGFPNDRTRQVSNIAEEHEYFVPLDMEMDPEVVQEYADEILSAMGQTIPTMSIAASLDDMFGPDGFYFGYNDKSTVQTASVEVLYGDGEDDTNEQVNAGVFPQSNDFLKRSLRLVFRSKYDNDVPNEWNTNLFQRSGMPFNEHATKTHRSLILRAGNQRSWARTANPDATAYTIDQFYRDSQRSMSGVAAHGVFVHLYLNGVYWGVYNVVERPDDDFAAQYFGNKDGGDDNDDWFHTNHGGAGESKNQTRWNYLTNKLVARDMTDDGNYRELQEYLNVKSFIDYCLLAFFIGLTDWPDNNWYAVHRLESHPKGATPVEFLAWDGEWALDRHTWDLPDGALVPYKFQFRINETNPILDLWHAVLPNHDFRSLLAERVAFHTASPGGALTVSATVERWNAINRVIESAIIGESARWGDSLESLGAPYDVTRTRNVDWQNEVDLIRGLLETNTEQFIDELVGAGFYSRMTPPVITPSGGDVATGSTISIENPNGNGRILYTLDGSNPTGPTGLTYEDPITISESVFLRATIADDDGAFSVLSMAVFRVPSFVITEIQYHPSPPTPAEKEAGYTDGEDFEYIKLRNIAERSLNLEDFYITDGIAANPGSFNVDAGAAFVLVANSSAFRYRYGNSTAVAGTYTGSLDNGGERIVVEYPAGIVIADFTYDDKNGWPTSPDGEGPSLEIINETGDFSDPANWRASSLSNPKSPSSAPSKGPVLLQSDVPSDEPASMISSTKPNAAPSWNPSTHPSTEPSLSPNATPTDHLNPPIDNRTASRSSNVTETGVVPNAVDGIDSSCAQTSYAIHVATLFLFLWL